MTVNFSRITQTVHTVNNPNLPLGALIVEIPTDIGRSYQGYKRGGILEGAEKFRKEVMSAGVWLAGIPAFKWLGDKICEKILKVPMAIDFSLDDAAAGNTSIKDSIEYLTKKTAEQAKNYLKDKKNKGEFYDISDLPKRYFKNDGTSIFAGLNPKELIKKTRGAKIATSISAYLLNIFALSIALPLINQALTRRKMAKMKKDTNIVKFDTINEFKNKTKKEKSSQISFKGGLNSIIQHPFATFVDGIENSATFRLIAPDAPMILGRVKTSRNKYEALETVIIDGSGIFLYNFCADCIQTLIRKFSKNPKIPPKVSEIIANKDTNTINEAIAKLQINPKQTAEELFGKQTAQEIYKCATYGKYGKINKYVKKETLAQIDGDICAFLEGFKNSTKSIQEYTKSINGKNALYLGIGLLVAIMGQAIIVPKTAFKITEILTGKNQFTGIAKYDDDKKKQN